MSPASALTNGMRPPSTNPEIVRGADENRPVGVVAHHVGEMIPTIAEIARRRTRSEETVAFDIDATNARHAAINARPDQAETVNLIRDNGARAAELTRGLSDESLARAGGTSSTMTAEQVISRVLVGHFAWHEQSIRATVEGAGRP
jgi:hypothetical protein